MAGYQQRFNSSKFGFRLGMSVIFLVSLILRFWGLSRFNTLVFDEVYYAQFANNYLTNTPFFNAHPPLSQYIIAIGIWIGSHLPFGQDTVNDLAGSTLSTWSYRWINALTGAFIPVVCGAIIYQLTSRRTYTLLASLLIAADGFFLVESRYALNNIYIVIFGLLGQLLFIVSLKTESVKRWIMLIASGICFGASVAVKWNGLGFILGLFILLILAWIIKFAKTSNENRPTAVSRQSPLENLTQLSILQLALSLGVIPLLFYLIAWIPHLQISPEPGLWELQTTILKYHKTLGSGPDVHPYCAAWYTWPLTLRPLAYFYQRIDNPTDIDPSVPPPNFTPVIYDVHAMGNPPLWWFSVGAILLTFWVLWERIITWVKIKNNPYIPATSVHAYIRFPPKIELWLLLYLLVNWLANWTPWMTVTRCVFLYHYMSAFVFAALILAWWIDRWLQSNLFHLRLIGTTALGLILLGFVFWMPIFLGLPLSPEQWQIRMWFPSWI
ncbi:MAG: phospholipid carrier-dependent glycosyltransferase [Lyngbya sp.]|nr:phospholipid carrier-dependent glycosyltransferase [Lyngbya sp.]